MSDLKFATATQVAQEIINRGKKLTPPRYFTPMQLLKLVYVAHGWMLGLYGRPLIVDDVEAWMYGPVIPTLYKEIKHYRDQIVSDIDRVKLYPFDKYESKLIDQVIDQYGKLSGAMLSRITHAPNTPWSFTYKERSKGHKISNDLIADHYQLLYLNKQMENER